jgi:hypothetical protein
MTLPPAASSSPWRSRPNGGREAAALAVGGGGKGGEPGGDAGGGGLDSGSVGPGSAAGDSPGMKGSEAIHHPSTCVSCWSWLGLAGAGQISAGIQGLQPHPLGGGVAGSYQAIKQDPGPPAGRRERSASDGRRGQRGQKVIAVQGVERGKLVERAQVVGQGSELAWIDASSPS